MNLEKGQEILTGMPVFSVSILIALEAHVF